MRRVDCHEKHEWGIKKYIRVSSMFYLQTKKWFCGRRNEIVCVVQILCQNSTVSTKKQNKKRQVKQANMTMKANEPLVARSVWYPWNRSRIQSRCDRDGSDEGATWLSVTEKFFPMKLILKENWIKKRTRKTTSELIQIKKLILWKATSKRTHIFCSHIFLLLWHGSIYNDRCGLHGCGRRGFHCINAATCRKRWWWLLKNNIRTMLRV